MRMHKILGDATSLGIGYGFAAPDPNGFVHNILMALPVSQSVIDEIVKALAGLILAVISRWLYARMLEKKPTIDNQKAKLPDEIVFPNPQNIEKDGDKKTQISK